jgi:hypothetical protein
MPSVELEPVNLSVGRMTGKLPSLYTCQGFALKVDAPLIAFRL